MKQNKPPKESLKAKSNYTPLFIVGGIVLIIFVFVLIAKLDTSSSDSNQNYITTGDNKAKETVNGQTQQTAGGLINPSNQIADATYGEALNFMLKTLPLILLLFVVFRIFSKVYRRI